MTEDYPIYSPRKLIEVALPLDIINAASSKEKAIRQGHPSSLHLWWARRPLVTARAMIFAQLVNDPGYQQGGGFKYGKNKKEAAKERKRLFDIIEELVLWENTANETVLEKARAEIRRSWREVCELNRDHPKAKELFDPDELPGLHDPFAGGGAIPLEAQRLGLESYASDLNPVAVLINKAMIELPPKFARRPPVNTEAPKQKLAFDAPRTGARGLADDVRFYGQWVRDEAERRIGYLYQPVKITNEMVAKRSDLKPYCGRELNVIAWIWARTVQSPNPAFGNVHVPLASTFMLSASKGKEVYIEPIIRERDYEFEVRVGTPPDLAATKRGCKAGGSHSNFLCLMSKTPMPFQYIRDEGMAGRIGERLMAVVAEGDRKRVYLSPTTETEKAGSLASPTWKPELDINYHPRDMKTQIYGMTQYGDLFTSRQLVALTTFSELIGKVREIIIADALAATSNEESKKIFSDPIEATAYADAVCVYLAFALDKQADLGNSLCRWEPKAQCPRNLFGRQAIPMMWDFAEGNVLGSSSGSWNTCVRGIANAIEKNFSQPVRVTGVVQQADASTQTLSQSRFVSTDPPYYDNIGYADLSDFFYVWLRPTLRGIYPELFATMAVPKAEELVATPYRHGSKTNAEQFFLNGMTKVMQSLSQQAHPAAPITIYYAFKQSETNADQTSSTGWETFLEAVNQAGLSLQGTWPVRTENASRMAGQGMNALASSIVLVCRKRPESAAPISRRDFIRELNQVLPEALDDMTRGIGEEQSPVAPVDLSQAIIGPGMAVFSKYSAVLEADGEPMTVRTALQLINRFLAEDDFDKDTQFCLHWFEQYGWDEGVFGEADVLARAKATSVSGLDEAGVIQSGGGIVRLLRWSEYPTDWDPTKDSRTPVWEALHHLIRGLKQGGESAAGELLAGVQGQAEAARQLAYRLYTLCERKGWAEDAGAYNELITSWSGIETATPRVEQRELF